MNEAKKKFQEVLFYFFFFSFFSGIRSGKKKEGKHQGGQGTKAGELVFIIHTTSIECQARPADSSTEADNQAAAADESAGLGSVLFFLVPFLGGGLSLARCLSPSLLLLPHHHHSIRNYTWLYTALLTVLIIPICSLFPPCLALPCVSSCLDFALRLCLFPWQFNTQGTNPLLLSSDVIHQLDSHFCFPRVRLLLQRTYTHSLFFLPFAPRRLPPVGLLGLLSLKRSPGGALPQSWS